MTNETKQVPSAHADMVVVTNHAYAGGTDAQIALRRVLTRMEATERERDLALVGEAAAQAAAGHLAELIPPTAPCTLGVGCEESGVCYAGAHGQPEQCGAPAPASTQEAVPAGDIVLPPLPKPYTKLTEPGADWPVFTVPLMQSYARDAVQTDRARRAGNADAVRDAALEEAARLIETTHETTTSGGDDQETRRHLTLRKRAGDLTGMTWAAGIRALKGTPAAADLNDEDAIEQGLWAPVNDDERRAAAVPMPEPVAWANWKVDTDSYVPFRTREKAEASVRASEISATQEGPYRVVGLVPITGQHSPQAGQLSGNSGEVEAQRLDFMIENTAFIVWTERDGSIRQCQLLTQDEDENYIVLSGEQRYFNTERDAIDAAIAAMGNGNAS